MTINQAFGKSTAAKIALINGWLVWIRVILSVHYLLTSEKHLMLLITLLWLENSQCNKMITSPSGFLTWITDNKQSLSDFTQMTFGVPQGSVLGHTLFLLFINDLSNFLKHCLSDFYAVHTNSTQCQETIENDIQDDADISFTKWKTKCLFTLTKHFTCYRQRLINSHQLNISIDNWQIKQTSIQKLLGVHVDDKLTWTTHINHLCTAISSKISLFEAVIDLCFYWDSKKTSMLYFTSYWLWVRNLGKHFFM